MITNYVLQKNTYSGQKFAKDTIEGLDKETTLLIDSTYYSEDINSKTKAKGIKIVR